jgi:hypothetical protein
MEVYGVVGSINTTVVLETNFKLPRIFNDYTSHRCEAMGILSAITIFEAIQRFRKKFRKTKNFSTSAIFYCDNEAVTITTNKHHKFGTTTKDYYKPDFDIIANFCEIRKKLWGHKNQVKVTHIKGHQDKQCTVLTHPAELNVRADILATLAVNKKSPTDNLPQLSKAALYINDLLTTADHKKFLRRNYLSMDMRDYYADTYKWKQKTIDQIWWEVHEAALLSFNYNSKKLEFIQKMIHKKLPCNYRQHKYYRILLCSVPA